MTMDESAPERNGPDNGSEALDEARSRRVALGDAAERVEDLIARPASDPDWTTRVAEATDGLLEAFEGHVDEVEGENGLLLQVQTDQPRLSNGVKRMYAEHVEIRAVLDEVLVLVRSCGGPCDETVAETIRLATVDLLRLISRHRQAGADLVYKAYNVDIGGG